MLFSAFKYLMTDMNVIIFIDIFVLFFYACQLLNAKQFDCSYIEASLFISLFHIMMMIDDGLMSLEMIEFRDREMETYDYRYDS